MTLTIIPFSFDENVLLLLFCQVVPLSKLYPPVAGIPEAESEADTVKVTSVFCHEVGLPLTVVMVGLVLSILVISIVEP